MRSYATIALFLTKCRRPLRVCDYKILSILLILDYIFVRCALLAEKVALPIKAMSQWMSAKSADLLNTFQICDWDSRDH